MGDGDLIPLIAITIPCDYCGAARNDLCRTRSGILRPLTGVHCDRWYWAREALWSVRALIHIAGGEAGL